MTNSRMKLAQSTRSTFFGRASCFCVCSAVLWGAVRPVPASGADQSDDHRSMAAAIVAGFNDGRAKFKTGTAEVRDILEVEGDAADSKQAISESNVFLAFDTSGSQLRFDRTPVSQLPSDGEGEDPSVRLILQKDGAYYRRLDRRDVSISALQAELPIDVRPFHPLALGLLNYHEQIGELQKIYSVSNVLETVESGGSPFLLLSDVTNVSTEETITVISWNYGPSQIARRLIGFDTEKDYVPVWLEEWLTPKSGITEPRKSSDVKLEWSKVGNVWCPVTVTASAYKRDLDGEPICLRRRLILTWSDVNETLPEDLFLIKGLDPHGECVVTDLRLGTPIVVSHPNIKKLPEQSSMPVQAMEGSHGSTRWKSLLFFNVVVLIGLSFVVWLRRRGS